VRKFGHAGFAGNPARPAKWRQRAHCGRGPRPCTSQRSRLRIAGSTGSERHRRLPRLSVARPEVVSRAGAVREVPCREAESPRKSGVTEFTHPTRSSDPQSADRSARTTPTCRPWRTAMGRRVVDRRPAVPRRVRCAMWLRDHFHCRYCGGRVIPNSVLELVSEVYPEAFPYHPNWKAGQTHPAFAARAAMVDHVVPGSFGGAWLDENNL
jgi:hypothetical protein